MFLFTILAIIIGLVVYVICGKEKEVYTSVSELSWFKLVIKVVYKLVKYRKQGVLQLDKSLVYVAGTGNADCTLEISARNHTITVQGIRVDEENVAKYKFLCGYNANDGDIPLCYAESLFMKPLIALISSTKFSLSPIGLIHIRQNIKQFIPLQEYIKAQLTLEVSVKQYRQYDRGVEVDINLRAMASNTCVWEGMMTLLSRGQRSTPKSRPPGGNNGTYEFEDDLDVPGNCGVDYAKLTGDWNPHHLYTWSAWLLGYKKPIAHGMWTLSRTIAELQRRYEMTLDGQYELSCAFKRPLFMPGKAVMKYDDPMLADNSVCKILVEERDTSIPHLTASLRKLY
ncbi:3-hydroxyacyl-thioester dehydratase X-like [Mercenaria mercenaria]|uniref:3-hydroxyacyl-thioester dehydratase X-like n=1 Tax=Mercenaria mercenaria TaxID=6596 RepID=UPI00234EFC0B|nr:3-hydroxyacyl-thioester dehydratase X-like [Mercenaria mercenaria]